MLPVIVIILAIFVVVAVVSLILHPIQTLRKLARFITGLSAVMLVLGSVFVFLMPKTSFGDWIGPVLLVVAGLSFAALYNLLAPSRAA
ncbi:MAG: hypothetical protein JF592_18485 [Microbacterium sp.]|uniref:hypothetical protein n=1 Tax=Microbacterium sp. TaxID=51671 RepID=UPI001E075B02|nr:hypothetical protein [Microbacterium sp.]MBW8764537.1 hypothetical protein [Microbacterium sp.]